MARAVCFKCELLTRLVNFTVALQIFHCQSMLFSEACVKKYTAIYLKGFRKRFSRSKATNNQQILCTYERDQWETICFDLRCFSKLKRAFNTSFGIQPTNFLTSADSLCIFLSLESRTNLWIPNSTRIFWGKLEIAACVFSALLSTLYFGFA